MVGDSRERFFWFLVGFLFCFFVFLHLLFLNCLQLKIICMSKWHIWGGVCDALRGITEEGMPEGESGEGGGSKWLSCLLLTCFLFCAVTHQPPCPSIVSNIHKTLSHTMAFGVWDLSRGTRNCITLSVRSRRKLPQEHRGRTQRRRETKAAGFGYDVRRAQGHLQILRNIRKGFTYLHVWRMEDGASGVWFGYKQADPRRLADLVSCRLYGLTGVLFGKS